MNKINAILVVFVLLTCNSCIKEVKDALDETTEALTCANLIQEFEDTNEDNPERSCSAILADIDKLEDTCSEYLSESSKQSIAELRAACSSGS